LTTALARAGHEPVVVAAHNASSASQADRLAHGEWDVAGRRVPVLDYPELAFDDGRVAAAVRGLRPDAIVGVTALGASLACRLRNAAPLWADLFGDFMAEAQAKAAVHGNDTGLLRFWTLLQPVLERADRFSAVSRPQADAVIGQLGLAGRLGAHNAGADLVSVMPCAAEPPGVASASAHRVRPSMVPASAFVVLWSGSFNTWCDVTTLFDGLEQAMRRDPSIYFLATGGAVAGHDERTFREFESRVRASALTDRFRLLGWVDPDFVEACCVAADVGVVVERDLYERRLGSENRVVQWMARGLACVTTARSELGRCLSARGLAMACRGGEPSSLADVLVSAAADRARVRAMGEACRAYCVEHFNFERAAAPLLDWCAAPVRAADHGVERAVSVGLLSQPGAMAKILEGYLDELHLGQVLYRSVRWLGRRTARGVRARRRNAEP
jgi:glycosyltransferase involved in cell wall biosynthesis